MTDPQRPCTLLVISPERRRTEAVKFALDKSRDEGHALLVLYLLDDATTRTLADRLSSGGFLSEEAADGLAGAVKDEQYEQGVTWLQDVKRDAGNAGVPCEFRIESDPIDVAVPAIVRKRAVRHAILTGRKPGRWARWFQASPVQELASQLPCPVTILEY